MDGRADPLMDRKVVVIFGVVADLTAGCSVVVCGVAKCNVSVIVAVAVVVVEV